MTSIRFGDFFTSSPFLSANYMLLVNKYVAFIDHHLFGHHLRKPWTHLSTGAHLVSQEPVVSLVDVVLPHVLVLPDPDLVLFDGVVVDLDLPARLDSLGLAKDDVTRVVGEDSEEGRGGGRGAPGGGGGQDQESESGFHCD